MITTKSGKNAKGSGVELNSNYVIQNVIDNTDWQKTYGQGSNGNKPVMRSDAFESGLSSWGAKLDGSSVFQFDGVQRPYSAVSGNIGRFYKNVALPLTRCLSVKIWEMMEAYGFLQVIWTIPALFPTRVFSNNLFHYLQIIKLDKHLELQLKGEYISAYTHNRSKCF